MTEEAVSNVCPRCEMSGSRFVKNVYGREYIYFKHYEGREGKSKKYRYCYVRPVSSYDVANRVYVARSLGLLNILSADRLEYVLRAIENIIGEAIAKVVSEKNTEQLTNTLEKIMRIEEAVTEAKSTLEEAIKKLGVNPSTATKITKHNKPHYIPTHTGEKS